MSVPVPTPPQFQPPAMAAFRSALRLSDLLVPKQLALADALAGITSDTEVIAAALVSEGILTQFQADRLLAGKTEGFHLGPYVILEQIGRGAKGRVYKARHRTMNRSVAVKVVAQELTRTRTGRDAFQAGVSAAAQLNHPNIVATYDANQLGDRFYIVSEFVDGPSLEALVAERGPLPVGEACDLIRQAAEGLAHAHELGIYHGDLKPANLLVARPSGVVPEPQVKIADFGAARLPHAPHPHYIAPERTRELQIGDPRADLYSLGAVLYFLLTGRPPFTGGKKVNCHRGEEPERLATVRPDVWPRIDALVHDMLAKCPDERPATAAEVAARLGLITGGGAVSLVLPVSAPTAFRYVPGPLSNTVPVPPSRILPCGSTPPPTPSPWEQITLEQELPEPGRAIAAARSAVSQPNETRQKPALPDWTVMILAAGVLVLCLLAAVAVVRAMAM